VLSVCGGNTKKKVQTSHYTRQKTVIFLLFSFFSSLSTIFFSKYFSKHIITTKTHYITMKKKDRSKRKKNKKTREAIERAKAWAENRKNRSQVPIAAMVQNQHSEPQLVQEKTTENFSVTDSERQLMLMEEAILTLKKAASDARIRELEEKVLKSNLVLEQMRKEYDERMKRLENNLIQVEIRKKVIEALMTVVDEDDN